MARRVAGRALDYDFAVAKHVVVRCRDERRLAAFQRAEVLWLRARRWRISEHHIALGFPDKPRRAREQVGVADMVPMKMRKREIRDVGRRVADFVELRLQLPSGRTVSSKRPGSAGSYQPIGYDADVPHQRPLRMRDKET